MFPGGFTGVDGSACPGAGRRTRIVNSAEHDVARLASLVGVQSVSDAVTLYVPGDDGAV